MLRRALRPAQVKFYARSSSSIPPPSYTQSQTPSLAISPQAAPAEPAPQAPNHAAPWSTSQRLRPLPKSEPRFEQTAMDLQPAPLSAMELINNEPIRLVDGRRAVCDGGAFLCWYLSFAGDTGFRWRPIGSSKDFHKFGMYIGVETDRTSSSIPRFVGQAGSQTMWVSTAISLNYICTEISAVSAIGKYNYHSQFDMLLNRHISGIRFEQDKSHHR